MYGTAYGLAHIFHIGEIIFSSGKSHSAIGTHVECGCTAHRSMVSETILEPLYQGLFDLLLQSEWTNLSFFRENFFLRKKVSYKTTSHAHITKNRREACVDESVVALFRLILAIDSHCER